MTRRRNKPKSPEQIMAERLEREKRQRDIAHLKRQEDVRVVVDRGDNLVAAERLDVFSLLLSRKAITLAQYTAARRLEADIAASRGLDASGGMSERVSGARAIPVSDRMLDASDKVKAALSRCGPNSAKVLQALLVPQFAGILTRWRETVSTITTEKGERAITAAVRMACQNLAEAYIEIDYQARSAA